MPQWMAVSLTTVAETDTYRDVRARARYHSSEGVSDSSNTFITDGGAFFSSVNRAESISIPFGGGDQLLFDQTVRINKTYGSTQSAYFAASITGINYWGSGQTVWDSATMSIPARAFIAPNPPHGVTVTRTSDTRQTVAWTRGTPTAAGPYQSQRILRQEGDGPWQTIATLNTSYTTAGSQSWADTTTVANRFYRYIVQAVNSGGVSSSTQTGYVYTTPTTPTSASATKLATGDVRITITPSQQSSLVEFVIEHSTNGGTSWAALATVAGGTSPQDYTHVSPDPIDTHTYRVAARIDNSAAAAGDNLQSGWRTSNTIQLAAPPNAPSGLSPSGPRDATEANVFTWIHNPVDTSDQTKFQIRHRADELDAWTTEAEVVSSVSEWTLAADTYSNGEVPEWEVRTWGQHADPSPWSATASFPTYARPTVAISAPSNGATLTDSALSVDWSYFQAEAFPQSQWRATLSNGDGSVVETRTGSGTTSSVAFETAVKDGQSYTIRVEGRASFGMWSLADEVTVDVSYLPPSEVLVSPTFDRDSGAALLALSRESWDDVSTVEPIMVSVERSVDDGSTWTLVAQDLSITGPDLTIPDALPLTRGTTLYRTIATSATPSSVTSDPVELEVNETERAYLNYGPGFGTALTFYGNLSLSSNAGRVEVVENFAGRVGSTNRPAGVLISGETRSREVGVAATLLRADGVATHEDFEDAALTGGVMAYRDPTGRRMFGRFTLGGASTQWAPLADVTFTITELGHTA